MRVVRAAPEAEVVASFLRGELDSPRWGERLLELLREDDVDSSVVRTPNLDDAAECAYRAKLLDRHRAWLRREGLFEDFPEHVAWSRVALGPGEVLAMRYINWDWWLLVSGGTRRPVDAAARIRRNEIAGVTAEEHEPIAARLRATEPPPARIAVVPPDRPRRRAVDRDYLARPVPLEARRRRDELPDDDVLLQAEQPVDLALDRRVGEHLRRLLEGGGGEERLRRERRLRDPENQRLEGRLLALLLALGDARVLALEDDLVDELPRQQVGVARILDAHLLQHLPDDQLDVL